MGVMIAAAVILSIFWALACRRRLAAMEQNINNAMAQIGVQISSRFDALTALLELTKGYAGCESQAVLEAMNSRRSAITAVSTPDDVLVQERVLSEALGRVSLAAGHYPELKASEGYARCMDAVDNYGKMVYTSHLIYNDSVARLNRELRRFPACLAGGLLGFHRRDYLEAEGEQA